MNKYNRGKLDEAIGVLELAELELRGIIDKLQGLTGPDDHPMYSRDWRRELLDQVTDHLEKLYVIRARDDAARGKEK